MEVRHATSTDLARIADIFHAAFPDSVAHIYGPGRRPNADLTQSLFEVCLRAEPEGFYVVTLGRIVTGYLFAPAALPRVWRQSVSEGYVLRWLWGWASGRYRLGWRPIRLALANKLSFLRHALRDRYRADARILSIAVHPDFRGKGCGRRLCTVGVERFDRMGVQRSRLEVRPDNEPAVRLYTDLGYRQVGTMRDSQGDWWVMLRNHPDRL